MVGCCILLAYFFFSSFHPSLFLPSSDPKEEQCPAQLMVKLLVSLRIFDNVPREFLKFLV